MYEQIKALKIRVINLALFLFKLGVLVDYTIMDMGASKLIRLLSRVLVSIKLLTYGHIKNKGLIQKNNDSNLFSNYIYLISF